MKQDATNGREVPLGGSADFSARQLAEQHGLHPMGIRPGLREYLNQVWGRRHFTWLLAKSKAFAENQSLYLGQLWSVLNPILNALVYIIVFGLVLKTGRGLANVGAFIVVGTFIFRFFSESIVTGSKSIRGNLNLVRSLHFPRAVLPLSTALAQFLALLPALVVMCVVVLLSGLVPSMAVVSLKWSWFLLIPAVLLLAIFNIGASFIVARWVAQTPDIANVIPFVLRFVMYGSGVIFSFQQFITNPTQLAILEHQPVAVYLYLARISLLNEPGMTHDPMMWVWGAGWAIVTLVIGVVYFWRAEARYGRD